MSEEELEIFFEEDVVKNITSFYNDKSAYKFHIINDLLYQLSFTMIIYKVVQDRLYKHRKITFSESRGFSSIVLLVIDGVYHETKHNLFSNSQRTVIDKYFKFLFDELLNRKIDEQKLQNIYINNCFILRTETGYYKYLFIN